MKQDFIKSREELDKEQNKNQYLIDSYNEKASVVKANQFEYQASITIAISMIAYAILFIPSSLLLSSFPIFSSAQYTAILFASSLGIGTIMKKTLLKNAKLKDRLKAFSKAKTQAQLIEEEVNYKIELEKAKTRNHVVDKAISTLGIEAKTYDKMSKKYNIYDKTVVNSENDIKQELENLSSFIKEQYEEMDLVITQKVLHDRFWKIRSSWLRKLNILIASLIGGIGVSIFAMFPMLMITPTTNLITLLTPTIIGALCGTSYMAKRNQDYKSTFHHLNSKLGKDALPETTVDIDPVVAACQDQNTLNNVIENKIGEISAVIVQLKEQQRALEKIKLETPKQQESELKQMAFTHESEQINISLQGTSTELSDAQEKGPILIKKGRKM